MKKLSLILALAILASAALSCGETVTNEVTTLTDEVEPVEENPDPLPEDLAFDGQTVNFYSCDYIYNRDYAVNFVTEENGEVLNDAQYYTELWVEDRLGIEIVETLGPEVVDDFDAEIRSLIMAQDTTYDIYTNMDRYMITAVMNGMFIATSDLPHVNLDAEYWNPKATSRFSVGHKIYYTMTSFNLCSYSNTNAIFMNADIADEMRLDGIYDLVRDGKWTYDKLKEYAQAAYRDLNGNTAPDLGDQFGFCPGSGKNAWVNAVVGAGLSDDIMHKDSNDYFVYELSDKMYDVLEMYYNLVHEQYVYNGEGEVKFEETPHLFHDGKLSDMLGYRELEYDFSVLPIPKYYESQDSYYCRTYDTFFTMAPTTCTKTELCGAALEALSYKAHTDLLPAYINDTLQVKLVRDEESAEMIRIALDTRTISLAEAYMFSLWGNYNLYSNYICGTNSSPASYIDSVKAQTEAKIDEMNTTFKELIGG